MYIFYQFHTLLTSPLVDGVRNQGYLVLVIFTTLAISFIPSF